MELALIQLAPRLLDRAANLQAALGWMQPAAGQSPADLYLLPELHGRALGSRLLRHAEREVRRHGGRRLILAVNKRNAKAIAAYQRNGFVIAESAVTDIGGGFVMDDFIMAKELA